MAEIVQGKSRGLKFAEQQLLRHGWEQGKGLGRKENGILEAIKVKVKCDKGGVGHKEGEQFTFHWWDHVFNKASASLQVESDQNGVFVKKTVEEAEEGPISNKKPRKATLAKAKLYGCFVKSATLLSGQEQPEPKASNSDDSSSSDDEDQKLDLSSTTKLSDADLMKACGGRTAHKGARHGLTMSAKLARLEQQEADFMAKYGRKSQSGNSSQDCATPTIQSAAQSPEREEEATDTESQRKKSKKMKKKKSSEDCHENVTVENGDMVTESCEMDTKPKKKKKKKKGNSNEASEEMIVAVTTEEESNPVENGEAEHSLTTKRKHDKKIKNKEENGEVGEMTTAPAPKCKSAGVTEEEASPEQHTDTDTKTKKKKKKKSSSKHCEEPAAPEEVIQSNDTESNRSEPVQDPVPKKKKKRDVASIEEREDRGAEEEESTVKRKKCKEDVQTIEDSRNEEAVPPKKKKKKKSKEKKMQQN